jgi:trans-aconitate methyltransferase
MAHDFDGRKYQQASAHQREWGSSLIAELDLKGDERVLDLGCGDGTLTVRIADLVPAGEVVGIDASRGMIEVARRQRRDNLRFVLMDISDLDFAEESDLIFSNATLHWVKDHGRLLRRVRAALRHNGTLRFNFAGDGNCSHFFRVIREVMSREAFSPHFAGFQWPWYMPPVDEYRALVASSGLRGARVWGENADRYFPDAEAMIRWIEQPSLVPFMACVPEAQREPFREFVVRRMVEDTQQADGRCFETFRRINVSARK